MLGLLLRQRVRLFWNRVARGPRRTRRLLGAFLATVFTIGFVILAGVNASLLIQRVARTDPEAATQALPLLLIGVFALTLVTSLSSAFHHLFMASDLELLLAAPVPVRSLFWLKVFEIWRDSLHVLLFQSAALYGFGQTLRLPAAYYFLAVLVGISVTLAAAAIGATITLGLARVRFGDSILGLSRLWAILLFLPIGILGIPALGFGRSRFSPFFSQGNIDAAASSLRSFGPPPTWAPTTWAAHLLLGDEAAGLSLALLVGVAMVVFATAQLAFDAQFAAGWERVRFAAPRRRSTPVRWRLRLPGSVPDGPIVGLLQKDWRTLMRDPRWRTGALVSLVALSLPAMALFAGDPFARTAHVLRFWLGMLPIPYLAYLFGSQQGAATLAYEGRNIALLRAAPVSMGRILLAKALGGLVLVVGVVWAATLALGLSHAGEPLEIAAAMAAATWLAVGGTSAAMAGAALTADFEGDNPQRRIGCLGTIVTTLLSSLFFAANTGLVVWWVTRAVLAVPRPLIGYVPIVDWGLPIVAVLSVGVLVAASRMGLRRLANWEIS
jgi:ABC-2 type transport system permease protein